MNEINYISTPTHFESKIKTSNNKKLIKPKKYKNKRSKRRNKKKLKVEFKELEKGNDEQNKDNSNSRSKYIDDSIRHDDNFDAIKIKDNNEDSIDILYHSMKNIDNFKFGKKKRGKKNKKKRSNREDLEDVFEIKLFNDGREDIKTFYDEKAFGTNRSNLNSQNTDRKLNLKSERLKMKEEQWEFKNKYMASIKGVNEPDIKDFSMNLEGEMAFPKKIETKKSENSPGKILL
eukprot:CAMPEP_0205810876 /NCGR_PEP_ID=MMETSP0205-20121125/15027_1 /ASSEMBLY_ACC=CAM_ASM_000278 /TAXON_ID=36767 /ORGANISM="Euplotes focardii, Strain TN1" /LENGTH=231 /DNA_ID=CAMNT_0053089387 /DNA_START=36 /DNA_END=728 /DNA_ORIENTATION=+